MASFALRYHLTESEYVEAFRLHLLGHYARPSSVALIAAALTIVWIQWRQAPGSPAAIALGLAALAMICFRLYAYWRMPYLRLKRSQGTQEEHIVDARDAGIHFRTPRINVELPWQDFRSIRETHDLFILYKGKNAYLPIPKRVIGAEDQQVEFRQLVTAHIKGLS